MVFALLARQRETFVQTCRAKFERNLDQPLEIATNAQSFIILEWWESQETTYRVLSTMARDLLTILVTTMPSESACSGISRVVST